jgi:polyhydroxybutyrate depolymerase
LDVICDFQFVSHRDPKICIFEEMKLIMKSFSLATLMVATGLLGICQSTNHTLVHNGVTREYRVYIPASYNAASPAPLVINLHGYTSDNITQEFYGDFRPISDTAGFILVHPNGTFDMSGNRWWNAYGFPGVDDVGFISALIDELAGNYSIDLSRVYSCGMSNGGIMSCELACALSNKITAIASVTGSMPKGRFSTCNPSKPIPMLQIHGTADSTVPFNGNSQFEAVEDVVAFWVNQTGSSPIAEFTALPDINPTDGCTAEWYVYADGINGASVEFYKVLGGGHTWPGAPLTIGVTNRDFDASGEIWRFFSQFNSTQLASTPNHTIPVTRIFPNPSSGNVSIVSNYNMDEVIVMDVHGRLIEKLQPLSTKYELNLQQKGVYILQILSNDIYGQHRIILE